MKDRAASCVRIVAIWNSQRSRQSTPDPHYCRIIECIAASHDSSVPTLNGEPPSCNTCAYAPTRSQLYDCVVTLILAAFARSIRSQHSQHDTPESRQDAESKSSRARAAEQELQSIDANQRTDTSVRYVRSAHCQVLTKHHNHRQHPGQADREQSQHRGIGTFVASAALALKHSLRYSFRSIALYSNARSSAH